MTLNKIIRKYLIRGAFLVMTLGCITHFIIFRYFTYQYNDKILYEYKKGIEEYVEIHNTLQLYASTMLKPSRIEERIIENPTNYPVHIKDTVLYNEVTKDYRSYRQLYFTLFYKNQWHLINVNQPIIESDDLLTIIVMSLLLIIVLLILFIYLFIYFMKKDIGIPFYRNLKKLRTYDVKANAEITLTDYSVTELNEFNEVIRRMVNKINEDYENSRIFIEDASHEMQTPLSVIKSRLELLMQDDFAKKEEQVKNIIAIFRATTRLSRLNRSLSLLTKINNDHFQNKEPIDFSLFIRNYVSDLEELIITKEIILDISLETFIFEIDPILADKLISNLINNAIFHNNKEGIIKIELKSSGKLLIENTCTPPSVSKNLFNRMVHGKKEYSTGLGLNIVKSICDKNNIQVKYKYLTQSIFQIKVYFKK